MLIDTSGLLCYYHLDEPRHAESVELFVDAKRRVTHDYILAEFLPLCRSRGVDFPGAIELVEELLNNDEVEVYWIDEALHRAAVHLLKARPDKTYSLCDAVSFVLMRQLDIDETLPRTNTSSRKGSSDCSDRSKWENIERVYRSLVDHWEVYDNSGVQPILIEQGQRG